MRVRMRLLIRVVLWQLKRRRRRRGRRGKSSFLLCHVYIIDLVAMTLTVSRSVYIYISQQKVKGTSRVPNKRPCRRSFSSSRSRFHRSSFTSDVSPPPKTICAPIRPPLSLGMQLFLCYCPCILLFTYIDRA